MSRTFRCKNYILENRTSWDLKGSKIAGLYTEYDYVRVRSGTIHKSDTTVYRYPTKDEIFKLFKDYQGESRSSCHRSPCKYHRKFREHEFRLKFKSEISKFIKGSVEDVILSNQPVNCWWDWS